MTATTATMTRNAHRAFLREVQRHPVEPAPARDEAAWAALVAKYTPAPEN